MFDFSFITTDFVDRQQAKADAEREAEKQARIEFCRQQVIAAVKDNDERVRREHQLMQDGMDVDGIQKKTFNDIKI